MKAVLAALAAGLIIASAAPPAAAHEEIEPATITVGTAKFMTLIAANEEDADLVAVTLTAPEGVTFGHGTRSPAGWTGRLGATVIEWNGGAVAHATFEEFGFEIEPVDQPGTLVFAVTLGFAGGATEEVDVAVEAVVAVEAPSTTEASTTTTGPTTTSSSTTGATAPPASSRGGSDGNGVAVAAGAVAALALIVAIAALVAARRSRGGGPVVPAPAGPGQDW